jgi:hypothetical protein
VCWTPPCYEVLCELTRCCLPLESCASAVPALVQQQQQSILLLSSPSSPAPPPPPMFLRGALVDAEAIKHHPPPTHTTPTHCYTTHKS